VAPEQRQRTNADPVVGGDGWTEIERAPFVGEAPALPEWLADVSGEAVAIYRELAGLPQAATWGPGTWFELHLALPLIERYLKRPGSENFKAIISTLGAGLRLTEDDMQRGRLRWRSAQDEDDDGEVPSGVSDIAERRKRLTG